MVGDLKNLGPERTLTERFTAHGPREMGASSMFLVRREALRTMRIGYAAKWTAARIN